MAHGNERGPAIGTELRGIVVARAHAALFLARVDEFGRAAELPPGVFDRRLHRDTGDIGHENALGPLGAAEHFSQRIDFGKRQCAHLRPGAVATHARVPSLPEAPKPMSSA